MSFLLDLTDKQHMYEAHPDAKYPSDWSSTDQSGERAGYISLEKSEVYAKTAQGAFDLAGLGKVVKVSPGSVSMREAMGLMAVCDRQLDA